MLPFSLLCSTSHQLLFLLLLLLTTTIIPFFWAPRSALSVTSLSDCRVSTYHYGFCGMSGPEGLSKEVSLNQVNRKAIMGSINKTMSDVPLTLKTTEPVGALESLEFTGQVKLRTVNITRPKTSGWLRSKLEAE